MTSFNPIDAWLSMKAQLPPLAIQDIGLKYLYPFLIALVVLEYVKAKHLYNLNNTQLPHI